MRTLKLTIAYDGAAYAGWQRQANALSVQQVVEEAFVPLVGEAAPRPPVAGASRTDAGVHAVGQVASVDLDVALDADAIRRALNARLPADIRVMRVEEARPGFHARFEARAKHYRYRIVTADVLSPFARGFAWHRPWALDVDRMREAAAAVVGEHDFASFQGAGSSIEDTVRRLTRVSVARVASAQFQFPGPEGPGLHRKEGQSVRSPGSSDPGISADDGGRGDRVGSPWSPGSSDPGDSIVIDVEGTGFLRHMVRILVGTLAEVGAGQRTPASMADVLAARERRAAGITAPAAGLVLVGIEY
jgi:tRNA pseudouridine38-40 synthase